MEGFSQEKLRIVAFMISNINKVLGLMRTLVETPLYNIVIIIVIIVVVVVTVVDIVICFLLWFGTNTSSILFSVLCNVGQQRNRFRTRLPITFVHSTCHPHK